MTKRYAVAVALVVLAALVAAAGPAPAQKIHWGDSVPPGWNGEWPDALRTVAERTGYTRTASSTEVLEFINTLRWSSGNMFLINMFTTSLRRTGVSVVMAEPRVTSPEEAAKSGRPVVYLQGNIHAYEPEAKEALMMLMRDILLGKRRGLLDKLIIIVCPNFNVDGTDTLALNEGTPHLLGSGTNAQNINLNRDAVRIETAEIAGLYRTVFNRWDPVLVYDGHLMGRVQHGYAIAYATCTVPTAHPGPRDYVFDKLFPADREVVESVKAKAGTGELRNFVAGTYGSYGKADILMYKERNVSPLVPGTSVRGRIAPHMLEAPELVRGVDFLCKPEGTVEARVPRGYLIPAELADIAEKLRIHGVKVETLAKPVRVSGEEFAVEKVDRVRSAGYSMVKLEGGFVPSPVREFPAGTFHVDMAQPLANVAFY